MSKKAKRELALKIDELRADRDAAIDELYAQYDEQVARVRATFTQSAAAA